MSLKAKIEAVIYASEEPVTLAQLVGLLGVEGQGELERREDRQGSLGLGEGPGEPDPGAGAVLESMSGNPEMGHPVPEVNAEAAGLEAAGPEAAGPEAGAEAGDGGQVPATEAAEKKAARDRERKLREFFRGILEELIADYAAGDRGIEVREVAGGFRMATKPEYHDAVRGFVRSLKPPLKLSLQALETLAVVAYKQPVTAPEVAEIRGVDSGGVLGSLLGRKLITTAGRKQVIGRPILYRTTKDFLLRFGLKDISELPSIEEFEKLAGEMAGQEEIPMPNGSDTTRSAEDAEDAEARITHENLQEERNATVPQADGNSNSLELDDSNRPGDELPAVDGRMSGLPPSYDQPGDDPSADEAAVQNSEQGE